jgi:hypothetical protein
LYSGDFAMDLRTAAGAVARLPFDGDKLADLLCAVEPSAANDPADTDHTTFWLVLADQFAKKGIACERVREKALEIIDGGGNLAMLANLGMDPPGLKKRGRMLADLRVSLTAAVDVTKPRRVLQKPQAWLLDVGDIVVYPTTRGNPINPYFSSKEKMVPVWGQDGWGAAVIVERGRAFDFLTWYRPLTIPMALTEKPSVADLRAPRLWMLKRPGTCSAVHLKKMELEKVGTVQIDLEKFESKFLTRPSGISDAVSDISIANRLSAPNRSLGRFPTISALDEILT